MAATPVIYMKCHEFGDCTEEAKDPMAGYCACKSQRLNLIHCTQAPMSVTPAILAQRLGA